MKTQICVPILVKDDASILQQLKAISDSKVDLLEFRLDYCQTIDDVHHIDVIFNSIIKNTKLPYIITLRTHQEGGYYQGTIEQYMRIYQYILSHYQFYALDIEWHYATQLSQLISEAKRRHIECIISYHNFVCVPPHHKLMTLYHHMQQTQASIYKFAVTPISQDDLIRLLAFTNALDNHKQHIIIGMQQLGIVTRIMPSLFKSILTFGSATYTSAPGQISVDKLVDILSVLEVSH